MNDLNINQIVESGNFDLFKYLIDFDINLIDSSEDPYGRTPLIICSKYRRSEAHFKIAKCLLDSGCDVNIQANYKWNNWTALMTACYYGHTRLVELLVNSNSNLDLKDIQSNTACQIAIEQSNSDCVNLILNQTENKDLNEFKSSLEKDLQDAVFNNDLNLLKMCLQKILDNKLNLKQFINSTTSGNHTLLYRACRNSNPDIVKLLLDSNAIAKPHYYTKYSPLYIACHMGSFQVAKLILEKFPHLIQIETIEKFLPFHAACSQGHLNILKLLVNFNLKEIKKLLLESYSNNYINKLEKIYSDHSKTYFYSSLFDLNSLDVNDQSGLYHAVLTNQVEICEYLLSIKKKSLNKTQLEKFEKKLSKLESDLNKSQNPMLSANNNHSIANSKSSNDSFLDQLKSVFLDSKSYDPYIVNYSTRIEESDLDPNCLTEPKIDSEEDENLDEELNEEQVLFNPININQYSKFGLTCLHEALKNKNLKIVELLIQHGANPNLPLLDSNQNQISNSVVEAIKTRDDRLFYIILKNFVFNEQDFKLVFNFCFNLDSYGFKMLPFILKFKISNDLENKISLAKKISEHGLVLNWSGLEIDKIFESWLLNSCLNFKISLLSNLSNLNIKKFHLQSITRIDLSNNLLEHLPLSIFQIESLKVLKLSCNKLKSLPVERNSEFDDLSSKNSKLNWLCQSLEELELDYNQLVELPSELFSLKSLKRLNVSNNKLEKLPVELWMLINLYELNCSFNLISYLPIVSCEARSRKEFKRTNREQKTVDKNTYYNNQNQKQNETSELNCFKLKQVEKANFWNKNSQILSYDLDLNDQELDNEDLKSSKFSNNTNQKSSNESKLIELNLSNNTFKKIPECLSCLCPKLIKLNLSSNQIDSLGSISDLPPTLKFLDLSQNQIDKSFRILNKTFFKFIVVYLSMINHGVKNEFDFKKLDNLLLENDFCFFNLIQKYLSVPLKISSPSKVEPGGSRSRQNREQSIQTGLRSTSNRRRTRSQSRNPNRASLSLLPNQMINENKKVLPFDLFMVNLKYNRVYSSQTNDSYSNEDLFAVEEDELELAKKENMFINNQNMQIFLEQICQHKRHIKLENLKSLNLSNNKINKLNLMFNFGVEDKSDTDISSGEEQEQDQTKSPAKILKTKQKNFSNKSEEKASQIAKLLFPNLTHLDISSNLIAKLPGSVSYLENLSHLNSSSNPNLIYVSPKLGLLTKLWNFDLKMCPNIKDPTLDSLIKQKTKTSDILGYLKSILDNSKPYNRIKLMFVGVQAIGKTSLLNRLKEESSGKSNSHSSLSTVGIDISEWVYEKSKQKNTSENQFVNIYQAENQNRSFGPVVFRTWDFAGQKEYYTTHQYFISKRALYLVCWKLTEEEKGINEIHYWLSNIQTRAPGSPCIIVGTHQDQIAKLKNYKEISNYFQRLIYEKFIRPNSDSETTSAAYPPILASIEISSKTGYNIKTLARLIYDISTQMKVPGMKDQLLLEQKVPSTYLALEECINLVLSKLKSQSRNPVLNTQDYLNEIQYAISSLYPDSENENKEQELGKKGEKNSKNNFNNQNKLIRFRDNAEILQATQFLHDNGILIHYNDVALNDLYFLDPQWLCDVLSTVVTIREINPFAAKGIMKIKDLLVLFKGSKKLSTESEEIMSYIVDLLGKFELALTWDNEHLLIPSLLPTEPMLKYSNQDIRISIMSKQKLSSIINMNNLVQSASCISSFEQDNKEISSQLYSNVKLINSYSQMTLANKLNLEFLYECKQVCESDSLRRLYSLSYLPSGFFSRLIVRILCDSILKDCLLDLIEIEQCEKLDYKLIEFLSQEAEWKCWQTGIELKYLDYTLLRIKEIIQDPLVDMNSSSTNKQHDLFIDNSILFKDCENELKMRTINRQFCSFVECYASFTNYKIIKSNKVNEEEDLILNINLNKQICFKIFALIIEIIDSLLEDWYPDLGTRFMQDSKGDYLVTRLAPCKDCINLPKSTIEYQIEIDEEEKEKLKQFEENYWIYCFMLDDVCYSVLKDSKLICPKHGHQSANLIAPDLAFEDIEKNFLITHESLRIEKLLGRGSFGSVFCGSFAINNQMIKVAVKVLETLSNNQNNKPKESELIENITKSNNSTYWNYRKSIRLAAKAYSIARQEIAIISSLKHENIVTMIGLCIKPLSIILELAPLGNLKDILQNYKKSSQKLNPYVIQQVCAQTSSSLVYLHSNRIIYRDLKADNVLVWKFPLPNQISSNLNVLIKLADYSISRCVLPTGTKGFAGTPGFMAPEILKYNGEETYSEKVDCFSFSMLLYELITLKHPFEGQDQIKDIILNGGRPIIKAQDLSYPSLMLDLMCLCWLENPSERPSSNQLMKYTQSYEFSHLIDVTILDDFDQAPLFVSCLNQENEYVFEPCIDDDDFEDEEEIEEDLIDLWVVRNCTSDESNSLSQVEILTYENKLNCTNRKQINISNQKIEAIGYLSKINQIWFIDSNKSIFIYCSKTYKKLNQYLLEFLNGENKQIISIIGIDTLNQVVLCTSNGLIVYIILTEQNLRYHIVNLNIKCFTTLLIPNRTDNKCFDLWIGSDNSEIFCYSLKAMKITGIYPHSSSHHFLANSLLNNSSASYSDQSSGEKSQELNVTILKTTQVDTFFMWSYVYPGSTIYLWNHTSKKLMSGYNCKKAFEELNYETKSNREFKIVDLEFLNSNLYCGINNGFVIVLKRLTLTPLQIFSSHQHQLYKFMSLTFETRLITYNRSKKQNASVQVKKTQSMLLTLGRALAPIHEDIYLSNLKYRIDSLQNYANCLILNSWNCNYE